VAVLGVGEVVSDLGGRILEISASRARLLLDKPVEKGVLLKVQWNRSVILGEATACLETNGQCMVNLHLLHLSFETREMERCWGVLFPNGQMAAAS
jgi:hypothetical protein